MYTSHHTENIEHKTNIKKHFFWLFIYSAKLYFAYQSIFAMSILYVFCITALRRSRRALILDLCSATGSTTQGGLKKKKKCHAACVITASWPK